MDSEKCVCLKYVLNENSKRKGKKKIMKREREKEGKPDLDFHNDWILFLYPFFNTFYE